MRRPAPGLVRYISDVAKPLPSVIQVRHQSMYSSIFDLNIDATSTGLLSTLSQMYPRRSESGYRQSYFFTDLNQLYAFMPAVIQFN
jgi:hypothetical protein